MKRALCLLLSLLFLLSLAACSQTQPEETKPEIPQAESQTTTEIVSEPEPEPEKPITASDINVQRQDSSKKDSSGQVICEHYYDLVIVKGESEVAAAINAAFQADYEEFLSKNNEVEQYLSEGFQPTPDAPFFFTVEAEVTNTEDNVLSVLYCEKWYMGGTSNISYRGLTFDLESGKPLNMEDVFPLSSTTVLDCVKNTLAYYIYQDNLSLDNSEELLQPESYCIQNRQLVLCFDSYTLGRDGTTIACPITLGGQMKTAAEQRSMLQKNEWIGFWCASEDNGQVSRLVMDMSFETDGSCSVAFGFLETEFDFVGTGTYQLSDDHILTMNLSISDVYEESESYDATYQFEVFSGNDESILIQPTDDNSLYGQSKGSTVLIIPYDTFFS